MAFSKVLFPLTIAIYLVVLLETIHGNRIYNQGHKPRIPGEVRPSFIETPIVSIIQSQNLPEEWMWNNVSGVNYLTLMRNQHIPQYCGKIYNN